MNIFHRFIWAVGLLASSTAAAAPDSLTVSSGNGQSGPISTGLSAPFEVTLKSVPGGTAHQGVQVIFAIVGSPSGATGQGLSATSATTDADGHASSVLTLGNKVGSYTVTATVDGADGSPVTFTATATPGVATQLVFVQQPSNTVAGEAISPAVTVRIEDASGNVVTSDTRNITLALSANPGGGTLSGTTTVSAVSGIATFNDLSINKVGAGYTLAATSNPVLTGATSGTFNITAGVATQLVFAQQPSNAAVEVAISPAVTVRIEDALGNLVSGDTRNIMLAPSANPGGATLSGTTTVAAVSGIATFNDLSINKVGIGYTLAATSNPALTGATSGTFNITAGVATQLVFSQQPSNTVAGAAIIPAVTVRIEDALGNLVTGDTRNATLALSANPGSGILSGTTTVAAVGGIATFNDLSINKVGVGYTLAATSHPALTAATSGTFNITVGAVSASQSTVVANPTTGITANGVATSTITVTVKDASGNPASGQTVILSATGSANTIVQPGGVTDANGMTTGTLASTKAETKTVTATVNPGASQVVLTQQPTVTFVAGVAAKFAVTMSGGVTPLSAAPKTAGVAFLVRVTSQDANGNTATSYTGTVALTSNTFSGTVDAVIIAGGMVDGTSMTPTVPGVNDRTIDAGDGVITTLNAAGNFTVNPGALDHFVMNAIGTQTAGTPFSVTITAQDVANNTATGFTGPVSLTTTAGTITPNTISSFTNGVGTAPVTVTLAGTGKTITADDGAGHQVASNAFTVLAMPNLYVSSDPLVAAAGVIYPNTFWTTTTHEPDDWSYLGSPVISFYLVPEAGMIFNNCTIALTWDTTKLSYSGFSYGSPGTPNGLFSSGQTDYTHTESVTHTPGTNSITIAGARTNGTDFTVAAGDYIVRIDFTLANPGYSPVNVQSASFQRTPSTPVQVTTHKAELKAYLGDVARAGSPSIGDGKIDFEDLSPWSVSYWSGVPGYAYGLTFYKVKYDFGPTQNKSVFTLPTVDGKIDFEDLVIFSMSYGLSLEGQLPKIAPLLKEQLQVSLGEPVVSGGETRIGVMVGGAVSDVRAMRIEVNGEFGAFLGVDKGLLLKNYQSPVVVMSRSDGHAVFVDLAVMGLDAGGVSQQGEMVVLRFQGTPRVQLTRNDARNSANAVMPVIKVRGAGEAVPTEYQLHQNYPNPFNPTTMIEYEVPAAGEVTLEVYNMLGQRVATLVREVQEAGFYHVQWNGMDMNQRRVASGIYFYRMHAGQFSAVKKMMLLK